MTTVAHDPRWTSLWVGELSRREIALYNEESRFIGNDAIFSAFHRDLGAWFDHDFLGYGAQAKRTTARDFVTRTVHGGAAPPLCVPDDAPVLSFVFLNQHRVTLAPGHPPFAGGRLAFAGSWEAPRRGEGPTKYARVGSPRGRGA